MTKYHCDLCGIVVESAKELKDSKEYGKICENCKERYEDNLFPVLSISESDKIFSCEELFEDFINESKQIIPEISAYANRENWELVS